MEVLEMLKHIHNSRDIVSFIVHSGWQVIRSLIFPFSLVMTQVLLLV